MLRPFLLHERSQSTRRCAPRYSDVHAALPRVETNALAIATVLAYHCAQVHCQCRHRRSLGPKASRARDRRGGAGGTGGGLHVRAGWPFQFWGGTPRGTPTGVPKCPRSRTNALAIAALLVVRWDSARAAGDGRGGAGGIGRGSNAQAFPSLVGCVKCPRADAPRTRRGAPAKR
jgi:hypothetical protein